jgi:hypothetical protein
VTVFPARINPQTIALTLVALLGACSTATPSGESSEPAGTASVSAPAPGPSESSLPTPAPSGFGFSDEAVIGYYESRGFVCDELQPSATAAGYFYQGCQMEDANGRTLAIGLVTDPSGDLADGYASVQGARDETILEPIDALDHLSGFLGAMLGEHRGTSLLEWLAGHLGDAYAETTIDVLVVATYTQSSTDHSRLYLELANHDYIGAPVPSVP